MVARRAVDGVIEATKEIGGNAEEVAKVVYVGLKVGVKPLETDLEPGKVAEVWAEFGKLMTSYARPGQGYTARRAMEKTTDVSDFDHLSRFGEWDETETPVVEDVP
jgi:hypothetical protein